MGFRPAAGDFHNRRVRRYECNLAQANAMLDCLGWRNTNRDGIREDRSGNNIAFTIEIPQGKAVTEFDHDKRVEYYHEIQEIVAEQSPMLFTTLAETLVAVRDVFGNTTPTLYGLRDPRYLYRTDQ